METKICLGCKVEKPVTEFHKGSNGARYNPRCKPCRKLSQSESYKQNWFRQTVILKKSWCAKNGVPFDLDSEYLTDLWTDYCPVFGIKFEKHSKRLDNCPHLDRLVPSKGYTKGNVVWISGRANRIKYDATVEELRRLIDWYEGATTISKESTLK
jgi:hypothetical protein